MKQSRIAFPAPSVNESIGPLEVKHCYLDPGSVLMIHHILHHYGVGDWVKGLMSGQGWLVQGM